MTTNPLEGIPIGKEELLPSRKPDYYWYVCLGVFYLGYLAIIAIITSGLWSEIHPLRMASERTSVVLGDNCSTAHFNSYLWYYNGSDCYNDEVICNDGGRWIPCRLNNTERCCGTVCSCPQHQQRLYRRCNCLFYGISEEENVVNIILVIIAIIVGLAGPFIIVFFCCR